MFNKMKQLFELQGKVQAIKKELENSSLTVQSRNGEVKIVIRGDQRVSSISVSDSLISLQNKASLEAELADCVNDAIKKSQNLAADKMKEATGLNLPGL